MPNNKVSDDLNNNVVISVYGVSQDINQSLSVADDSDLVFTSSKSSASDANNKNLSDMTIRDGRKQVGMDAEIARMMEDAGRSNIHNLPFNERIMLNKELNFIVTQMPQLADTISSIADNILSPDLYNASETIDVTVNDSALTSLGITISDINAVLENADYRQHVKEGLINSLTLGYSNVAIVPYNDIAQRIMSRNSDNTKFHKRNNKKQYTLFGERINSDSTAIDKKHLTSINLIAETTKTIHDIYSSGSNIYAESDNSTSTTKDKSLNLSSIVDNIFDGSPYNSSDKCGIARYTKFIAEEISNPDNADILFAEADITEDNEKSFQTALRNLKKQSAKTSKENIKKLSGCSIEALDNENTFPIIINKELIGVLKIDLFQDKFSTKPVYDNFNNVTGSSMYRDKGDYADNPLIRRQIVDNLSIKIKQHLDENFIVDNKQIIGALEHVLEENDNYTTDCNVRFIPRKYLVPFNAKDSTNGLGKTKLLQARIPAIFWILLNNNHMMNKLFYEKDKIVIKYRTSMQQDLTNERDAAFDIFRNLFPLPSDLLNFTRTYSSMSSIGRLLIPQDRKGQDLFDIDRIEGQKPQPENDDAKRECESTIENILGFPLASLNKENNSFEYATAIIAQDGRLTTKIMKLQEHYQDAASELATKILRNYFMSDSIVATARFKKPKTLNTGLSNEQMSKFNEQIDGIMNTAYGETLTNPVKIAYMRRKIATDVMGQNSPFDLSKIDEYEKDWKADKNVMMDNQIDNQEN